MEKAEEKAEKPLYPRVLTNAASLLADIIKKTRNQGTDVVQSLALKMEEIAQQPDDEPQQSEDFPLEETVDEPPKGIKEMIALALEAARSLRLIDKINIHLLPQLLNDKEEDERLKYDIIDHLNSRLGTESPLSEEIKLIAIRCFDKGVEPQKLINFFESELVIGMLLENALRIEHSRFRAENLSAAVSSALDSVSTKIQTFLARLDKKPLDKETEEKIEQYFDYFNKTYDPKDSKHTVTEFILKLKEKYPEQDILSWISKNKKRFIYLIRGYKEDQAEAAHRHIEETTTSTYEEKGRKNPDQFIKIHRDEFLRFGTLQTQQRFIAGLRPLVLKDELILDANNLEAFFESAIRTIRTKETGEAQIREKILKICLEFIEDKKIKTIYIIRKNINEGIEIKSEEAAKNVIKETIQKHTKTYPSYLDITTLLSDPKTTPVDLEQTYQHLYDEQGNLDTSEYRNILKSLFGIQDKENEIENIRSIKKRISKIYKTADKIFKKVYEGAGLPDTLDFESVADANDFAELVELACTGKTPEERFAARRKYKLGWLIYSCKYNPRFVNRQKDAARIQARLLNSKDGIKIDPDKPFEKMSFIDHEDGTVQLSGKGKKRTIKLIPITFGEIPCYLLPANQKNSNPNKFINIKSLESNVIKVIHHSTHPRDIKDILRITMVADSTENALAIHDHIVKHYVSFGRTLKIQNLTGNPNVSTTQNIGINQHSSDEYRVIRYVIETPIRSDRSNKTYLTTVEIRILLKQDLANENSEYHTASHKEYEKRRLNTVMRVLAPEEICPELYERTSNPADIFKREKQRLKDASEFTEIPLETSQPS